MADMAENGSSRGFSLWRVGGWSGALLLLLSQAVAMQLSDEVNWTGADFAFAAIVLGGVGGAVELTVRMSRNWSYRAAVAAALAAAFLTVAANGAVGMIGDEDNRYNLLFLGVIGLALTGAVVARFRPAGMAYAMAAAAIGQVIVAAVGLSSDVRGGVFSAAFAGLWLFSAALLRKAARDQEAGR